MLQIGIWLAYEFGAEQQNAKSNKFGFYKYILDFHNAFVISKQVCDRFKDRTYNTD